MVLATFNPGKARELADLLAGLPFDVVALGDVPSAALPPESGATYTENALAKARAAARLTGALALGDDSGLEVDALGGAPGLHSARYGGAGLDDAGRRARLLDALRDVPDARRTARFRCVIAVAEPDGKERVVEGITEGVITCEERGSGGFGYDAIFLYPPLGRTFAELSDAEKAEVSHRGRALKAVRRLLTTC